MSKEAKVERKKLVDVVDLLSDDQVTRDQVIGLLERGHEIKKLLGSARDQKTGKPLKGDPGYGLLAELDDIKQDLCMIQVSGDYDGLRFGKLGSQTDLRDGRSYLDAKELLNAGVTPEQISKGMKQSESFYVTTLFELK